MSDLGADARQLRNTLGLFATGVGLVTVQTRDEAPLGITINSFSSVSLDPPLVLWNLQRDSETLGIFQREPLFTVNILSREQRSLSDRYARKGEHALAPELWRRHESGHILLHDALAAFRCHIWARHDGGDHIILVGKVLGYESNPQREPLLFFQGRYRNLAAQNQDNP